MNDYTNMKNRGEGHKKKDIQVRTQHCCVVLKWFMARFRGGERERHFGSNVLTTHSARCVVRLALSGTKNELRLPGPLKTEQHNPYEQQTEKV